MSKPKILLIDCETLPNITYAFDLYSYKKPDMIIKEKVIVTFAYKWLNEKQCCVIKGNIKDPYNDKPLVKDICEVLEEADYVVAHYGDKFDLRFIRARALINGITPPAHVPSIDTYKLAKKYFHLNANRLDYLGKVFGCGRKIHTTWDLWERCANGDKKALNEMADYNRQDVLLLEKVFLKMLPYVESKLNHNLFTDSEEPVCHHCGSDNIEKRGTVVTKLAKRQRYVCRDCETWFSTKLK